MTGGMGNCGGGLRGESEIGWCFDRYRESRVLMKTVKKASEVNVNICHGE